MPTPEQRSRTRTTLTLMYAGAGLTAIAALVPFLDRAVLADHVRAGYPGYAPDAVDAAVTAYLVILAVVGALGLLGWTGTIWATHAGKRWATWLATALLTLGLCVAIAALTIRDTSGNVGLAPLLGWLLVVPCVPGLAAVVLSRRV